MNLSKNMKKKRDAERKANTWSPTPGGNTVSSINGYNGDISILPGNNITIDNDGANITISADAGGEPGGASSFIDLLDTPNNYAGAAGYVLVVNAAGDGIEFRKLETVASGYKIGYNIKQALDVEKIKIEGVE